MAFKAQEATADLWGKVAVLLSKHLLLSSKYLFQETARKEQKTFNYGTTLLEISLQMDPTKFTGTIGGTPSTSLELWQLRTLNTE